MLLRELAKLPPEKKREALAALVANSRKPANGQLQALLGALEAKYRMTTDEMITKFKAGQLDDTADIARWLVLSKASGRKRAQP